MSAGVRMNMKLLTADAVTKITYIPLTGQAPANYLAKRGVSSLSLSSAELQCTTRPDPCLPATARLAERNEGYVPLRMLGIAYVRMCIKRRRHPSTKK